MNELVNALYTKVWNLESFVDNMSKKLRDPLSNRMLLTKISELNELYDVLIASNLVDGYIDFKVDKEH